MGNGRRWVALCIVAVLSPTCAEKLQRGGTAPHPSSAPVSASARASVSPPVADLDQDIIPISRTQPEAKESALVPFVDEACRAAARVEVGATVARECSSPGQPVACAAGITKALTAERMLDEATKDRLRACACATATTTNAAVSTTLAGRWVYGYDEGHLYAKGSAPAAAPKCMKEALEAQDTALLEIVFGATDYGKSPTSNFTVQAAVKVSAPKPPTAPAATLTPPSPEENTRALRRACEASVDVRLSALRVESRSPDAFALLTPDTILDDGTRRAVAECICGAPSLQRATYSGSFEATWDFIYTDATYCGNRSTCACADGSASGTGACFGRYLHNAYESQRWLPLSCSSEWAKQASVDVDEKLAHALRKTAREWKTAHGSTSVEIKYSASATVEIVKR
jgi:hypothetical protein